MEMNVNKTLFIWLPLLILGCKSQIFEDNVNYDHYRIIEKVDYSDNSLNPKTISYEDLNFKGLFNYSSLNKYNVKYNSIVEKERYINFDTIFSVEKRNEINKQLNCLNSREIKPQHLENSNILSNDKNNTIAAITFPFIVESSNKIKYGFIYRNTKGLLYIYRKINGSWDDFARLEIHTAN